MIYLGAVDTVAASGAAVKACDLYSAKFLAWVDNKPGNLDIERVNRAATVSAADGRPALMFVRHGVLPDARERADELGVAVFGFDPRGGTLDGVNLRGRALSANGLSE